VEIRARKNRHRIEEKEKATKGGPSLREAQKNSSKEKTDHVGEKGKEKEKPRGGSEHHAFETKKKKRKGGAGKTD